LRLFRLSSFLVAGLLFHASPADADPVLTSVATKITSIRTVDGLGGWRVSVIPVAGLSNTNPAGCVNSHPEWFHIEHLPAAGRTSREHRLFVNAVYLAYMTNRDVQFDVRDLGCSTTGSSLPVRIIVGIWVRGN